MLARSTRSSLGSRNVRTKIRCREWMFARSTRPSLGSLILSIGTRIRQAVFARSPGSPSAFWTHRLVETRFRRWMFARSTRSSLDRNQMAFIAASNSAHKLWATFWRSTRSSFGYKVQERLSCVVDVWMVLGWTPALPFWRFIVICVGSQLRRSAAFALGYSSIPIHKFMLIPRGLPLPHSFHCARQRLRCRTRFTCWA